MPTADEILSSAFSGEVITIDVLNRTMQIPSSITSIGVESDKDVYKLRFSMPRYYGDIDLSTFKFHINYTNARGQGDVYEVTDAEALGDTVTFTWLIGRYAALYPGDVSFNVCLINPNADDLGEDDQEFNIQPATLRVLKGLETKPIMVTDYPNVIDNLLSRISYLEALSGIGGGTIIPGPGEGDTDNPGGSGGTSVTRVLSGRWILNSTIILPGNLVYALNISAMTAPGYDEAIVSIQASASGVYYGKGTGYSPTVVAGSDGILSSARYRYIDFGTPGHVVSEAFYLWFTANAVQGESGYDSTGFFLVVENGNGSVLYINGNTSNPFNISGDSFAESGIRTFKLSGAALSYHFTTFDGAAINLSQTADGWYEITQDTVVKVTSNGGNAGGSEGSGGTVYFTGLVSTSVYINGYTSTERVINAGVTTFYNVTSFKFKNESGLNRSFRLGAPDGNGASISMSANASGWYTVNQDITIALSETSSGGGGINTKKLSGKWKLNEYTDVKNILYHSVSAYTGSNYDISVSKLSISSSGVFYTTNSGQIQVCDGTGKCLNEGYRYLNFGVSGQEVNSSFYNWITANATVVTDSGSGEDEVVEYSVTNTLTHCSSNKISQVKATHGSTYTAILTAEQGYTLNSVTVHMNGVNITASAYSNGSITISNVTGPIIITAYAIIDAVTCNVTNNLTDCYTDKPSVKSVIMGESYTATIAPSEGYTMASVKVTVGGSDKTSSVYNSKTGYINIASVSGDVVITATASKTVYDVEYKLTNTESSNKESTAVHGSSYRTTISAKPDHYIWGVGITMGGISISNAYNADSNEIYISEVTGRIVISADSIAEAGPTHYAVSYELENCVVSPSGDQWIAGSGMSCKFYPNTGYEIDDSSVEIWMGDENLTSMVYTPSTDSFEIPSVTGEVTIKAVAKVATYTVTYNLDGCTSDTGNGTVAAGSNYAYSISVPSGQHRMVSLVITMGDKEIKNVSYDDRVTFGASATVLNVTGNIVITAKAVPFYTVTKTLSGCSINNNTTFVNSGESYAATISVSDGYDEPTITVKMGGNTVNVTGKTINIPSVTGDIEIIAISEKIVYYPVENNLTRCTNSNTDSSALEGSSYSATIVAENYYSIDSISVKMGGQNITSSAVTGTSVYISKVTGKIEITASASLSSYTVSRNYTAGAVSFSNPDSSVTALSEYTTTITANEGYKVTNVRVIHNNSYVENHAYDEATGTVFIGLVQGKIIITVTTEQICKISGKWLFNESPSVNFTSNISSGNITASSKRSVYDGVSVNPVRVDEVNIIEIKLTSGSVAMYYVDHKPTDTNPNYSMTRPVLGSNGAWSDDLYREIDFGTEEQEISPAFYNWFVANATQVSGHTVTITNGYDSNYGYAAVEYSVNGGPRIAPDADTVVVENVNTIVFYDVGKGLEYIYTGDFEDGEDGYTEWSAGETIEITRDIHIRCSVGW